MLFPLGCSERASLHKAESERLEEDQLREHLRDVVSALALEEVVAASE